MAPFLKSFLIGIIYRPPATTDYLPPNFNNLLDSVLSLIPVEGKEVSLLGDINCNYLVKKNNTEVKSIFTYGLKQLIIVATRITEESSTLIDVIITNEPSHFTTGFVMNSKLSFSRLFQKIVGEKYIIFPERVSENYIIFPENQ